MKKKFIIGLLVVLGIVLCVALGYVVTTMLTEKESSKVEQNKEEEKQENKDGEENKQEEKKYRNVVLDSKIGTLVLNKFYNSNLYSESLMKELNANGFSNKAKLMYTYIMATNVYDYRNVLKIDDEYPGSYVITKEDFENVAKDIFGSDVKIQHGPVFTDNSYNSEKGIYLVISMGFAGEDVDCTVEIPYEIREYDDKIEAYFYRVYTTQFSGTSIEDIEGYTKLYYDANRTKEIESTSSEQMLNQDTQIYYLRQKIENNEIRKENLDKVKYTLKEKDGSYYITGFDKHI